MNGGDQKRYNDGRYRGGDMPEPTEPAPMQDNPVPPRHKTHRRDGGKKKSWER